MVKIHTLSENNFILIGISSHQSDYKLSWAINKKIGIQLKAQGTPLTIKQGQSPKQEFTKFLSDDSESMVSYSLVSNYSENGYLIPKLKNIDFILKISGSFNPGFKDDILGKLKEVEIINLAFELEKPAKTITKKLSDL